jgi:formate hydrogenlyase subunit 3/multisubunit Na+/H+ antiporter MnhD subunit
MGNTRFLKSANDFVIGLALMCVGLFIMITDKIVQVEVMTGNGGVLVRPDTFVRIIGGLLAFFAVVLVLKSINWTKSQQTKRFTFLICRENILTVAALVVYITLLNIIHFFAATFLLLFFLTVMFYNKEISAVEKEKPGRKVLIKRYIVAAIYSAVLTIAVHWIFSQVLHVSLP